MNTMPIHKQLGLSRHPFPPAPDADGYFYTADIEQRLAEAIHCLSTRKGIVLLTGEVGMGKSTFVRRMLGILKKDYRSSVSLVLNTFLQGEQLLAAILRDFGLHPSDSAQQSMERLNYYLLACYQDNRTCVLVIDDAQNLTLESLELLRMLTNLETGQEKLLQIMLCGQPELLTNLEQPAIRQLTSRIVEHLQINPLSGDELARYVDYRFSLAGAAGRIAVSPSALRALYRYSKGNARRVHLIMDRCLYGLLPLGEWVINAKLVKQAALEAGMDKKLSGSRFRVASLAHHKPFLAAASLAFVIGGAALYQYYPVLFPATQQALLVPDESAAKAAPAESTETLAPDVPIDPAPATIELAAAEIPLPEPTPVVAPISIEEHIKQHEKKLPTFADLSALCANEDIIKNFGTTLRTPQLVTGIQTELVSLISARKDLCLLPDPTITTALWHGDMSPENFTLDYVHEDVLRAQVRLQALGYYPQKPDGLFGRRTRQGLQAFQYAIGLKPTGAPSALTLMLLAGAAPAIPSVKELEPKSTQTETSHESPDS